jgi:hypothetical protein
MGRPPKEVDINSLNISEQGFLVGMFIGDGSFCIDKKSRHYKVSFSLNPKRDQDIQKFIESLLLRLKLNPFTVFNNGSLDIRVNSKKLVEIMRKKLNEVSHDIKEEEYFFGLLSGLIDSDGCVTPGNIAVSMKNPSILKEVQRAAGRLGISTHLREWAQVRPPNSTIWRLQISIKFKTVSHLSRKIMRIYGGGEELPTVASA